MDFLVGVLVAIGSFIGGVLAAAISYYIFPPKKERKSPPEDPKPPIIGRSHGYFE